MNSKERMLAVFKGEMPDQIPTGELGVDYPITEEVLGHSTFYRAKLNEKKALWDGRRDEVVASQKQDLVALVRNHMPISYLNRNQRGLSVAWES